MTFFSLDSIKKLCEKSGFNVCFYNTCGDISSFSNYSQKYTIKNRYNFFKLIKKFLLKTNLKSKLKVIVNKLIPLKNILSKSKLFNSSNFLYGGQDRSCLRIVLKNN